MNNLIKLTFYVMMWKATSDSKVVSQYQVNEKTWALDLLEVVLFFSSILISLNLLLALFGFT